jgi:transcriptional regulator with GAF, ATPase, and Fis domain
VINKEIGPDCQWPGNIRELEQAVRCILLNRDYCSEIEGWCAVQTIMLANILQNVEISAQGLLSNYCAVLYRKHQTYGDVAKITVLDPRTVKKYIQIKSQQQ